MKKQLLQVASFELSSRHCNMSNWSQNIKRKNFFEVLIHHATEASEWALRWNTRGFSLSRLFEEEKLVELKVMHIQFVAFGARL